MNQKERIVSFFPKKNTEVARICGVSNAAVSKWEKIPVRFHDLLLDESDKQGYGLEPEHFFDSRIDNKSLGKRNGAGE